MNISELKGMDFEDFDAFREFVIGNNKPKEKRIKKVGLAYDAFTGSFASRFQDFRLIRDPEEIADLDLVIFSGGEDISSNIYGERNQYCHGTNKNRDTIETAMYKKAKELNKKMFGVCRGHQLIGALENGTLFQDFVIQGDGDYTYHSQMHELESNGSNSIVYRYFKGIPVTSMHHQAIRSTGLRCTTSHKGIIESCESKNIITVQFHPEFQNDRATDSFLKFIEEEW